MVRERWMVSKEYKGACMEMLQDNLASLRAKAGLTQEELSCIIGCSRQTYYAIETKQREMSWSMFLSLCFLYNNLLSTKEMLDDLKVYPLELFSKFNEEVNVDL